MINNQSKIAILHFKRTNRITKVIILNLIIIGLLKVANLLKIQVNNFPRFYFLLDTKKRK